MISELMKTTNYINQIDNIAYSKKQMANEEIEIKSTKILNEFLQKIEISGTDSLIYPEKIKKVLKKLSLTKPGRKLFKRINLGIKSDKLLICDNSGNKDQGASYNHETNTLHVSFDLRNYYLVNQKLVWNPLAVTIAHELIHAMHYFENPREMIGRTFRAFRDFTTLEELLTICGLINPDDKVDLCENVFLRIFGCPFRENHNKGLDVSKNHEKGKFKFDMFIIADAIQDILLHMRENPGSINEVCFPDKILEIKSSEQPESETSKKILPLTLAINIRRNEIIEILMNSNINFELTDDLGGPFIKAIDSHMFDLVHRMVEKAVQANPSFPLKPLFDHLVSKWIKNPNSEYEKESFVSFFRYIHDQTGAQQDLQFPLLLQQVSDAAGSVQPQIFNFMMKNNIDVDLYDSEGNNFLMVALKTMTYIKKPFWSRLLKFHIAQLFLKYLKDKRFDLSHKNHNGDTVISLVEAFGNDEFTNRVISTLSNPIG